MDFETLVAVGGAVKALPGGKVEGYAVVFGDQDLVGDRFTSETDFGIEDGQRSPTYYAHGQTKELGTRRIGRGELKADEVGLFYTAQLDLADEYQAAVYQLAQEGRLGFSTGAASHLVTRKDLGGGLSEILSWPIAEVSLTPQPCEPRCRAVAPLKSLLEGFEDEPHAGSTFQDHSAKALAAATDFATRAASLKALRASDNRSMSDKAKALCVETAVALEKVADELKQLVAEPAQFAAAEDATRLYSQFQELLFETARR